MHNHETGKLQKPLNNDSPDRYIREMIENFQLSGREAIEECLLASPGNEPNWSSEIFISTSQAESFYSDIFHFWVRAFHSFIEDTRAGSLFHDVIPSVACRQMSVKEFQQDYFTLLQQYVPDEVFKERQANSKTYTEFEKRSFSDPYIVIDRPDIKSAVANSDGEFVAYFKCRGSLSTES